MCTDRPNIHRGVGRAARAPGAFTLLELLVVIGIIAVLVGILVPALSLARAEAQDVVCRQRLRELGRVVVMYANDWGGRLPGTRPGPGNGDLTGVLRSYTRTPWGSGIWVCPSHRRFTRAKGWTSSYGYNWQYLLAQGPGYPHSQWDGFANSGLMISGFQRTSETMIFIDVAPPKPHNDLWSYVQRPGDTPDINGFGRPAFRHGERANALFADAHTESVPKAFADPAKEDRYWHVTGIR